jgi:hypothetical protein
MSNTKNTNSSEYFNENELQKCIEVSISYVTDGLDKFIKFKGLLSNPTPKYFNGIVKIVEQKVTIMSEYDTRYSLIKAIIINKEPDFEANKLYDVFSYTEYIHQGVLYDYNDFKNRCKDFKIPIIDNPVSTDINEVMSRPVLELEEKIIKLESDIKNISEENRNLTQVSKTFNMINGEKFPPKLTLTLNAYQYFWFENNDIPKERADVVSWLKSEVTNSSRYPKMSKLSTTLAEKINTLIKPVDN